MRPRARGLLSLQSGRVPDSSVVSVRDVPLGSGRNDILNKSSAMILAIAVAAGLQGCAQGGGSIFGRGSGTSQLSSPAGSPTISRPTDGPAGRGSLEGGGDHGSGRAGDIPDYGSTRGVMRPGS